MSRIYDEEDLLESIRDYFQENLNTKISEINTEKGDTLLESITADDDHYVLAGELLDIPNHAFVNFSIDGEIETKTNYDNKASFPNLVVEIVFDNPKKPNTYLKSLRYMRAIYTTMLGYGSSVLEIDELSITKITPMAVPTKPRNLVVSGVSASVSFC